jgi:hypothetical protein
VLVASIATVNLRAELERRHLGEDDRITIKHQRERRRNLEGDYDPPVTVREAPTTHVTRSPSSPRAVGGRMALASHLHMVVWPHKF